MVTVLGANSVTGGYEVENSVRLDGVNDYLNFTNSAGNRRTWTYSTWVKRSKLINDKHVFFENNTGNNDAGYMQFRFQEAEVINLTGYNTDWLTTDRVFRDLSAWYHIVLAVDTTNSTAGNRLRLYVNGVEETSFSVDNNPDEDEDLPLNLNNSVTYIGAGGGGSNRFFNGYMAETVLIDGLQLTPTSFGEFDEDSGIWKPIDVSGLTRGTNGFYLDFKASGNLGNDAFGDTDLTEANLAAVNQSTDTCTNNFATFNALTTSLQSGGVVAYSEGNTKIVTAYSNTNYLRYPQAYTTLGVTTGKWYAEFKIGAIGSAGVGIANTGEFGSDVTTNPFAGAADSGAVYTNGGEYRSGIAEAGSQGTYTENDIIGCALDMDNLAIYWHKNGTYINSGNPTSGSSKTGARAVQNPTTPGGFYVFTAGADNTGVATIEINLGSPSYSESGGETDGGGIGNFNQAVPSGYFALCTKNLAKHG